MQSKVNQINEARHASTNSFFFHKDENYVNLGTRTVREYGHTYKRRFGEYHGTQLKYYQVDSDLCRDSVDSHSYGFRGYSTTMY